MKTHELDVEAELARFDGELSIEAAATPPASWYVHPAVLAREAETVFRASWQYACPADLVAHPGSYARVDGFGESGIVVRSVIGRTRVPGLSRAAVHTSATNASTSCWGAV